MRKLKWRVFQILVSIVVLASFLGQPYKAYAETTYEFGKCEMTIDSYKNPPSNMAQATGDCAGLVQGYYMPADEFFPEHFDIEGMVNYTVEKSGQQFEVGTPNHPSGVSILTVYTVKTQPPAEEPDPEPVTEPKEEPKSEPVTEPKEEPKSEPVTEPKEEPESEPVTEPKEEPVTETVEEPKSEPVINTENEPGQEEEKNKDVIDKNDSLVASESNEKSELSVGTILTTTIIILGILTGGIYWWFFKRKVK